MDPKHPARVKEEQRRRRREARATANTQAAGGRGKDEQDDEEEEEEHGQPVAGESSEKDKKGIEGGSVRAKIGIVEQLKKIPWKRDMLIEYILTLPLCDDSLRNLVVSTMEKSKKLIPKGKIDSSDKFRLLYAWNMAFNSRFEKDTYFPYLFESFARHCESSKRYFPLVVSPRGQVALGSFRKVLEGAISSKKGRIEHTVYLEMVEVLIKLYRNFDFTRDCDNYNLLMPWVGANYGFSDLFLVDLPHFDDIWDFR